MPAEWEGVFVSNEATPSIEQMIDLVQKYLFKKKHVLVKIILNQENLQRELQLLEQAYSTAVFNLAHRL